MSSAETTHRPEGTTTLETMAASEDKMPSTKERLASIVQGFESFDTEMKIGTRVEEDNFNETITTFHFIPIQQLYEKMFDIYMYLDNQKK